MMKKKLKPSSQHWLKRQWADPFVKLARQEGYRSRSAYKLLEMDEKYRLLSTQKNMAWLDLGSAPGGWLQVMVKKNPKAIIIGIDILPIEPLASTMTIQADFIKEEQKLLQAMAGVGIEKFDGILSDMAMNTIGHASTDHLRTLHLAETALDFALRHLKPKGFFLCKIFQGGASHNILAVVKQKFGKVHHVKPKASRPESVEVYLLALDYRG